MQYRVAYDVLQQGYDLRLSLLMLVPFLFSVIIVALLLLAALHDLREPDPSKRLGRGNPLGGLVLTLALTPLIPVCAGWLVCRPVVGQWRAKTWARAGDYEVAEGAVSGLGHGRKGTTLFTVAGVHFRCLPRGADDDCGGFSGTFTDPGVPADALRDGLPVRVAYHGDCVLRIEIAEAPDGGRPP